MAILVALLLDLVFREPPARFHPVVWMGRLLAHLGRGPAMPPRRAFLEGALRWTVGAAICVAVAAGCSRGASWAGRAAPLVEGFLLWPLFSFGMLLDEVREVDQNLSVSLDEGRRRLSRIVSRDTSSLRASDVREAALETLSENLTDSVVAPLFWFALLGLPGAALHRYANTADAMWGYRDATWEWKGKWAARFDDAMAWLPARLGGVFLWAGSYPWAKLPVEAAKTPSPNGGWTMGSLALGLGIRLGKPGAYLLNPDCPAPGPVEVSRGLRRVAWAGWTLGLLLAAWVWKRS